ncbi:hypothetical protein EDB19DRAFT_2041996 [Suillus lakei]|nr:hypothetical protein EDB19DRAFT_2041996 [Suillus lakei]
MSQLEKSLYALDWNNNISVAIITLVSYDYMLQFDKEVQFVWVRIQRLTPNDIKLRKLTEYPGKTVDSDDMSIPSRELRPAEVLRGFSFLLPYQVRYFGLFLAIVCACWGGLFYMSEAKFVLQEHVQLLTSH